MKVGDIVQINNIYKKEILDEFDESILNQSFEIKFITLTGIAKIYHETGIKLQIPIKYLNVIQ